MAYQTDDLTTAAALESLGHGISHIKMNGRKATFFFDEDLTVIANEIAIGRRTVVAHKFHQEVYRLARLAKSLAGVDNG